MLCFNWGVHRIVRGSQLCRGDPYEQRNVCLCPLQNGSYHRNPWRILQCGFPQRVQQCKPRVLVPKLSKRLKREESVLMMLLVVACDIAYVLPEIPKQPAQTQEQKDTLRNKMNKLREFIYGERD